MAELYLEFRRRLPADVIYKYKPVLDSDEKVWKRIDMDLWIKFLPQFGWVCVNEHKEIFSIPWIMPWSEQGDLPPEGKWVSCKGDKSYVYDAVYTSK